MKHSKDKKKLFNKDLLYKVLIFITTVSIISYFQPRDSKFNYQYDIDKPWHYGQLMATFDFPIYKSDQLVQKEQDSILAHFHPYYQQDSNTKDEVIKKLRTDYQTHLHNIMPSQSYLTHLIQGLEEVYNIGILATDEQVQLKKDSISSIMIVQNKVANQHHITELLSVKDAYTRLLNKDTLRYRSDILQQCNLNEYLYPNLIFDEARTESAKEEVLETYPWANGMVQSGQRIIDRGEIVTEEVFNILESLKKESIKQNSSIGQKHFVLVGQILIVAIYILCFFIFMELFRKKYYTRKRNILLVFALITLYCATTGIMVSRNFLNVNILPYAMLPIIIRVFLDSRTAFMAHVTTILICSICLRYPHEFILLQLAAGMVAIYSLRELSQRSQLFRAAFIILLTYSLVYFAYELATESDLNKLNWGMYIYFCINSILILFTYPLLFMLEKTFGFTSDVTLVELSNINNPLLRQMSETVPGTFQHSMQVANLAAEVANHIGAKSQLVRTAALYHDIGKMEHPAFFTENQSGGINPHKRLKYEQSAKVVINHVIDGLKLAEKHNLPKVIKDFITTHHGKGVTKYFYISWKNEHPNEEIDESLFTYPGPNPFTKEHAILMMADAVEAASRSLPEYTEESISNLVDKIIDTQVSDEFFKECPITFLDIATAKAVFKEKLKIIYHTRISYPELNK
ncbi:MAG: HDIG domain-containing protein [Bacteroides sp.]|nr:HDIG domain-containing protein [Bacteroides sp.]